MLPAWNRYVVPPMSSGFAMGSPLCDVPRNTRKFVKVNCSGTLRKLTVCCLIFSHLQFEELSLVSQVKKSCRQPYRGQMGDELLTNECTDASGRSITVWLWHDWNNFFSCPQKSPDEMCFWKSCKQFCLGSKYQNKILYIEFPVAQCFSDLGYCPEKTKEGWKA